MAGKTVQQDYGGSRDAVWAALVRTVGELGFTALSSDAHSGSLSFNTGRSMKSWAGQDLSATLIDLESNQYRIVIGGTIARTQAFGGSQVASWGEKKKLSTKVLDGVKRALASMPDLTAEPPATTASIGISGELQNLAALHESGALSDEEFQLAKARLLST